MKRVVGLAFFLLLLTGCASTGKTTAGVDMVKQSYRQISQTEAAEMMTKADGHVVVDVRRQDEYDAGHIPGAILIPNESIETERPEELPDLDQIILIYCRSGNRSKQASQKLADMGYQNIYEFGGINTWTGEIVTEESAAPEAQASETSPDNLPDALKPVAELVIEANGQQFYADFEDNSSAEALKEKLNSGPVEIDMHDYGGFEKVGPLPWDLPRNDESITTVPGDVILYQGNQITIYYDENTWNFTRLAKIGNVTREKLLEALGDGDVTVRLWIEWSE